MDYHNKRNMILNAFKWRDDIKKKNDEELFREMFLFLVYLSFFSNLRYLYNNYNKPMIINQDFDLD